MRTTLTMASIAGLLLALTDPAERATGRAAPDRVG